MNIKDLKSDQYRVISQPQSTLNINNLSPGSYKTVDPRDSLVNHYQEKQQGSKIGNFAKGVGNFFTSSEQGVGKSISTGLIPNTSDYKEAQTATDQNKATAVKLLQDIRTQREEGKDTSHLEHAYKMVSGGQDTAELDKILNPDAGKTTKQALGEVAGVGLDILSAGSYGNAAKGAKTGSLLAKSGGLAENLATKVGLSTTEKIATSAAEQVAKKTLTESALNAGKNVVKGAAQGYAYDVAGNLQANKDDVFKPGAGAIVGGSIPIVAKAVETALPGISKLMEKSNLRLTPVQKNKLGASLDDVTSYLSKEKIVGTPQGRYEKIDKIYNDTEDKFQSFLNKDAKDITIPKQQIIDQLEGLKGSYQNERDVLAIERQIDELKNTISGKYPDQVPVNRLNGLKRSTFSNAYNGAGDKVLDGVEHDMGSVLNENIQNATKDLKINGKSVKDFNKQYGTIIKARGLLKIASGRNQLGLFGRTLAGLLAGAATEHFGGNALMNIAVGGGTEEVANRLATPTRSLVGATAQTGSNVIKKTPDLIKKGTKYLATRSAGLNK